MRYIGRLMLVIGFAINSAAINCAATGIPLAARAYCLDERISSQGLFCIRREAGSPTELG